MNKDLEHLKWLSLSFYIYAGLTALFACFPFIHLFVGIAMVSGKFDDGGANPPPFFGWMFIGIASIFIITGFALAIGNLFVAKFLKQQKNYTFCFVVAVISCMFAPFGTILGVFTIIVLLRDSVKELFNGRSFSPSDNPPSWR